MLALVCCVVWFSSPIWANLPPLVAVTQGPLSQLQVSINPLAQEAIETHAKHNQLVLQFPASLIGTPARPGWLSLAPNVAKSKRVVVKRENGFVLVRLVGRVRVMPLAHSAHQNEAPLETTAGVAASPQAMPLIQLHEEDGVPLKAVMTQPVAQEVNKTQPKLWIGTLFLVAIAGAIAYFSKQQGGPLMPKAPAATAYRVVPKPANRNTPKRQANTGLFGLMQPNAAGLSVLSSVQVDAEHHVHLLATGNQEWLVGTGPNGFQLIGRVDEAAGSDANGTQQAAQAIKQAAATGATPQNPAPPVEEATQVMILKDFEDSY